VSDSQVIGQDAPPRQGAAGSFGAFRIAGADLKGMQRVALQITDMNIEKFDRILQIDSGNALDAVFRQILFVGKLGEFY